jgi:hypothetical protein
MRRPATTSVAVSETIIYTSRLDMVMPGSRMDVNTIAGAFSPVLIAVPFIAI